MLRTCKTHDNEEPEKKRLQNVEIRTPRKTRFTTDYDGTKIPFKKKKEGEQPNLLSKAFIAERVVEPRLKDRSDSAKLININLASSVGFQAIYNEPIFSKLPLNELLNSLELTKGVTLQTPLDHLPPFRSAARCGFKTSKALMTDTVCSRQTLKPSKKVKLPQTM